MIFRELYAHSDSLDLLWCNLLRCSANITSVHLPMTANFKLDLKTLSTGMDCSLPPLDGHDVNL